MKITSILLITASVALIVLAVVGIFRSLPFGARQEALYSAEKITCGACAAKLQEALQRHDGAGAVRVDVPTREVRVAFDPQRTDPGAIAIALAAAGYPARLLGVGAPGVVAATTSSSSGGCACCAR